MGNPKPFIIALAFGLIAVVLVYFYIQQIEGRGREQVQMERVVRSTIDIPKGTTISRHMVEEIEVNADILTIDMVTELDEILGQVSMSNIYEQQILLRQMFKEESTIEQLSRMLQEGERAVTVGVTEISGLGGNLNVGDRVDVMVTILSHQEVGVSSTFTVLRDIGVMALGQDIGFEDDEGLTTGPISKSVTLRINPTQAEVLALCSEIGSLRLALRHPDETFSPITEGTALSEFVYYTPTREDLEEQARLEEARRREEERRAMEAALRSMPYIPQDTGEEDNGIFYPPDNFLELMQPGPPMVTVELILGGESQIVQIESKR